jgi:hypothetical protein
MEALHEKAWEVTSTALMCLKHSRQLMVFADRITDFVFCSPMTELPIEEPGIRISEISKISDLPSIPGRTEYRPCRPEAVGRLCLDLHGKIEDAKIYIHTMTQSAAGIATQSVFVISDLGVCNVLDLIENDGIIEKKVGNYLIRA